MKKLIAIAMALALLMTRVLSIPVAAETPLEAPSEAPAYCTVVGLGWFYDEDSEHRVGFGLAAVSTGKPFLEDKGYGDVVIWPARGRFFMVDHKSEIKVRGVFEDIGSEPPKYKPNNRIMEGECIFQGEKLRLAVEVKDKGESEDWILIEIIEPEEGVIRSWEGVLEGGNVTIKQGVLGTELRRFDTSSSVSNKQ